MNPEPQQPKKETGQILFGPPVRKLPPEVQQLFNEALQKVGKLSIAAYQKPHKEGIVDSLIGLGNIICAHVEGLWKKPECRRLVEAAARRRNYFPLHYTNLIETPFSCADEMLESLPLRPAPGNEKKKRGAPSRRDPLNFAIHEFIIGVLDAGSLRYVPPPRKRSSMDGLAVPVYVERHEQDVIDEAMRKMLVTPEGRKNLYRWAKAFVTTIFRFRNDLLSVDCESGAFHEMVVKLREQRRKSQLKNSDAPYEKDEELARIEAFTQRVYKRLPKYKSLLRHP